MGLYSFVLKLPEDGTLVPRSLILATNCILLSAFVGWCINCKNMHGVSNKKLRIFFVFFWFTHINKIVWMHAALKSLSKTLTTVAFQNYTRPCRLADNIWSSMRSRIQAVSYIFVVSCGQEMNRICCATFAQSTRSDRYITGTMFLCVSTNTYSQSVA